jgi:hypothetical protein
MTDHTKDIKKKETSKDRAWRPLIVGVLVLLAAGTALGIGGSAAYGAIRPRNAVAPEDAAKAWAEKLRLPYRGAACTMFDTDDDGYVSCIVGLNGADQVYFQGLQCGEQGSRRAGGCKVDQKNPQTRLVLAIAVDGTAITAPRPGQ